MNGKQGNKEQGVRRQEKIKKRRTKKVQKKNENEKGLTRYSSGLI